MPAEDARDHYPKAFSCMLDGGGVKGGIKFSKIDESAATVVKGKVSVQDFNATIAY